MTELLLPPGQAVLHYVKRPGLELRIELGLETSNALLALGKASRSILSNPADATLDPLGRVNRANQALDLTVEAMLLPHDPRLVGWLCNATHYRSVVWTQLIPAIGLCVGAALDASAAVMRNPLLFCAHAACSHSGRCSNSITVGRSSGKKSVTTSSSFRRSIGRNVIGRCVMPLPIHSVVN